MPRIGGALDIVQVADPLAPQTGRQFLYFKSDGNLYMKNAAGTVTQVNNAALGAPTVISVTTVTTVATNTIYLANGTFNMTVPVTSGLQATIKNTGTGTITVLPASGVLDGGASASLIQYMSINVVSDGTNVWVI